MTLDKNIKEESVISTTCPYCGVGCGVNVTRTGADKYSVSGNSTHPANFGRLCTKGMQLADTLKGETRLGYPLVKGNKTSWQKSVAYVGERFQSIIEQHGADAIAFYVSGQLLTEDYYVANKLMKGFIGSSNIDTNSRLCMSSPVVAQKKAFGSDSVPVCYTDLEEADLIVITGSNMAWCHPVLFQRILAEKKRRPGLKLIVIDPRTTETAALADLHLKINGGTDLLLFNGLLSFLSINGYLRKDIDAVNQLLTSIDVATKDCLDLKKVAETVGVEFQQLISFYKKFASTPKVITIFSQGINQSARGVDQCSAIINCHLATDRIAKPGAGPFSITGQPNAMGGREVGGLATSLATHLNFDNKQHHQLLSEFWQTKRLATRQGSTAVDMFKDVAKGKIKAIWIMATNPVVSMPDNQLVADALAKCPLVVVSDCFNTSDTVRFADVVFPACGWGEKSGTVTNSERRISRQRAFKEPYLQAKPDWWVICQVAKAMGYSQHFSYANEAQIFQEHVNLSKRAAQLTKSFDLSGLYNISEKDYQSLPPFQWPQKEQAHIKMEEQRLFSDGHYHTPDGRANAVPVSFFSDEKLSSRANSKKYAFVLNSGRIRDHWHSLTRSSLANKLNLHSPEPLLSLHKDDAANLNVKSGDVVTVGNQLGELNIRIDVNKKVQVGEVFMPMHWTKQFSGQGMLNSLVHSITDPQSRQPAFKHAQVDLRKSRIKSHAVVISSNLLPADEFDYWVKQPLHGGYLYSLASCLDANEFFYWLTQKLSSRSQSSYWIKGSNEKLNLLCYSQIEMNKLQLTLQVSDNFLNLQPHWMRNIFNLEIDSEIKHQLISGFVDNSISSSKIVCVCKNLDVAKISDEIALTDSPSLSSICSRTGAASVCGTCIGDVALLMSKVNSEAEIR